MDDDVHDSLWLSATNQTLTVSMHLHEIFLLVLHKRCFHINFPRLTLRTICSQDDKQVKATAIELSTDSRLNVSTRESSYSATNSLIGKSTLKPASGLSQWMFGQPRQLRMLDLVNVSATDSSTNDAFFSSEHEPEVDVSAS